MSSEYAPLFASIVMDYNKVEYRKVDSTPSPNIPLSLPSGIIVKGIEMWLDLLFGMK